MGEWVCVPQEESGNLESHKENGRMQTRGELGLGLDTAESGWRGSSVRVPVCLLVCAHLGERTRVWPIHVSWALEIKGLAWPLGLSSAPPLGRGSAGSASPRPAQLPGLG